LFHFGGIQGFLYEKKAAANKMAAAKISRECNRYLAVSLAFKLA
jgi:hypothetical protein